MHNAQRDEEDRRGIAAGREVRQSLDNESSGSESTNEILVDSDPSFDVLAQLIGDHAAAMMMIRRRGEDAARRMEPARRRPLDGSAIKGSAARASDDVEALVDCDAIMLGTSTTDVLLKSNFLKEGAALLDISVPSNIDPAVFRSVRTSRRITGRWRSCQRGRRSRRGGCRCPLGRSTRAWRRRSRWGCRGERGTTAWERCGRGGWGWRWEGWWG